MDTESNERKFHLSVGLGKGMASPIRLESTPDSEDNDISKKLEEGYPHGHKFEPKTIHPIRRSRGSRLPRRATALAVHQSG